MNNILKFSYENKDMRVVDQNGEPWFVAKDLCDVLDIKNSRQAIARLDPADTGDVILNDAIGRPQTTTVVNESAMYELVLSSRKKEARQFKRWITHEVLPSIRKDGVYITDAKAAEISGDRDAQDALIARALEVAAVRLKEAENRTRLLEKDNRVLSSRVEMQQAELGLKEEQMAGMEKVCDYADRYIRSDGLVTFTDLGNQVGLSGRKMREWMQGENILWKNKQNGHWTLRKPYSDMASYYKVVYWDQEFEDKPTRRRYQLKFTSAGAMYFTMLYKEWKRKLDEALARL